MWREGHWVKSTLKGNVVGTTETYVATETKLKRIAWLSSQNAGKQFSSLMHYFNEESLKGCFHELDGKKAVGADGIDKARYGENLDSNIKGLVGRMKQMSYRPQAVRQVTIPKEGKQGVLRPLGISSLEDKLVQKMMQKVFMSHCFWNVHMGLDQDADVMMQ